MAADEPDQQAAPRRKPARLTREPGGRSRVVKVLLSEQEYLLIGARARVAGVSMQKLMVEAALAGDAQTAGERRALVEEFLGARRLVARIGVNLNQLAKAANAAGEIPVELSATLHATNRMLTRLEQAAGQLNGHRGSNGSDGGSR